MIERRNGAHEQSLTTFCRAFPILLAMWGVAALMKGTKPIRALDIDLDVSFLLHITSANRLKSSPNPSPSRVVVFSYSWHSTDSLPIYRRVASHGSLSRRCVCSVLSALLPLYRLVSSVSSFQSELPAFIVTAPSTNLSSCS